MSSSVVFEPFRAVPLSKFYPELRFEFSDLPDPLFDYALIQTARTMAKDGKLVRRRAVITPQGNVTTYSLRSPDGLEVCGILGIRIATNLGEHLIGRSFDPPAHSRCCGRDLAWYDDIENELHLQPHCACRACYYISLAVCPSDTACELPAVFYDDHLDLLLTGAKSRILRMDNKPWTNLQLAMAYDKAFNAALPSAAIDTHTHLQRGSIKMHFGRIL